MADLTTKYIGLTLRNPIIVSSSSLTNSVNEVKSIEELGAGAVALQSIFEEQIVMEGKKAVSTSETSMHPEAATYVGNISMDQSIHDYIKLVEDSKNAVKIPVIASVNCYSGGDWVSFAKKIEKAGADALELNVFLTDFSPFTKSEDIESRYLKIVKNVKNHIDIPVALKIGYYFTNIIKMLSMFDAVDIKGFVLFNRFLRTDINLKTMKLVQGYPFSTENDITQTLKWIALASDLLKHDISASGGVHNAEGVAKSLLVGANTVHIASVLYKKGKEYLTTIIDDFNAWLDEKGYKSSDDIRGLMACKTDEERDVFERSQFMKYYSQYR